MDANVGDLLDACEVMSDTSLGDAMNYDSAVDATANVCPSAGFGKLTVCPYAPIPAANDVYYFTGATHDGNNVNSSSAGSSDGCSNDGFTYVAPDRADQGQTFTTGHSATGYRIAAVWLQHVGYTENTEPGGCGNGTWWAQPAGVVYTLRITDPTHAGSVGFALAAETFTTLGGEGGWPSAAIGDINGDGMWIRFELATPVTVSGSTTYGFDLSVKANAFFEWLGSKDGTLAGGGAYNGNTSGQAGGPDNVMNVLVGDRVFLVQMTTGGGLQQDGSVSEAAQADATDSDVAQAGADP